MKMRLVVLLFLLSIGLYAQLPSGYYATATGTGYTLKTQLYNIINGHTNLGYQALWTIYGTSDRDNQYENDNTVFDLYSENPSGVDPVTFIYLTNQCGTYTTEGFCYNREHIVPQSIYGSLNPMLSDAHFVVPVDGFVNGMRSNHPHGEVAVASWTSLNGSKRGSSAVSGYTGTVFEPLDDFKGDIARMYFYFATRYEDTVAGYVTYPMFNGTNNQVFTNAFLTMLLSWHNQDPVSAREIARNNAIYAYQNNRNPFIDHPEYVGLIWGGTLITQTITFNAIGSAVFGTPSVSLTATASSGLSVSYSSSNPAVATVSGSLVTIVGAGTTTITASQAGDAVYAPAATVGQSLVITPKPLTVSATVANKVYDRTATATITGVLNGVLGTDDVAFNGAGAFASENAGTGIPVTSTSTLGGIHAGNYVLTQPTGLTANITPKPLTVSATVASKVYDRTTTATITGVLNGVLGTDDVAFNGVGAFASVNAGTGIPVTSTSTLGGIHAGNYVLTQPTGLTANITPKPLTVSATVANKVYDRTSTATITGVLNGVLGTDDVAFNGVGAFASVNAGTDIPVTSTSTLGGVHSGNYTLIQPTGLTGTITRKVLFVR
jgi:endonuclease I